MSEESQGIDHYEAVLADLKAKREQIDQAIKVIENLRGGAAAPSFGGSSTLSQSAAPVHGPGAFLGMSIADATKKLLTSRKQTLGNAEIVAALGAGGMAMGSRDPINTVGSVLTRRFHQVGDIVRVSRGTWGLAEWYPNRTFKRKGATKGDNGDEESEVGAEQTMGATSEPEQLSEPMPDDPLG